MLRDENYQGTFRIDDVSVNTDLVGLRDIFYVVAARLPKAEILLAVSPMVHDLSEEPQAERGRIFPKILGAMSDPRVFFRPDRCGVPRVDFATDRVRYAAHGLIHIDHRLMAREAQELSILASCSLVGSKTFVPPFNKWNRETVAICEEHGITLVKFEDGWRHVSHNGFDRTQQLYYFHEHDTPAARLAAWFDEAG